MALTAAVTSATPADGTFSATGTTVWNAGMSGPVTGTLDLADIDGLGTGVETALGTAVNTTGGFPTVGATLTSGRVALVGASGVLTDDAGFTFDPATRNTIIRNLGGTAQFTVAPASATTLTLANGLSASGVDVTTTYGFAGWTKIGGLGGSPGNVLYFGGTAASAGSVTGRTEINKAVTAFTDGVAKATFTVTIPNASHNATLEVEVTGICGAGGAIGAGEASASNSYKFNISRTAGVNAVVGVSAAFGAAASNVAGGTTLTATAAASAIAGAVGDPNTFTVNVTITKGGGASDNHVALMYGKLMNANATGVTIS